jgi:hypothetical protein
MQRVSLVKQELLTILEHMGSIPLQNGVCVEQSLVFFPVICRSVICLFVFFQLAFLLSILRFTVSAYLFGVFERFIQIQYDRLGLKGSQLTQICDIVSTSPRFTTYPICHIVSTSPRFTTDPISHIVPV